jgi:hypothetical protein
MRRVHRAVVPLVCGLTTGCYHYTFEQSAPRSAGEAAQQRPVVRYKVRRPTWFNGFIGTGTVNTAEFCAQPVRTELRVTGVDVLLSIGTLLIYTPHTLYVTCPLRTSDALAARPSAP